MDIIYNAKTYNPDREIEHHVKESHIQAILSIHNSIESQLDLSLLNAIIITEDYKVELFEFQRNNGHSEFVTENEYGQGFAQVVSSKSSTGDTVYNVIIDKCLIVALIGDNVLPYLKETLDAEQYETLLYTRQLAINTLCHELAHVHEYALDRGIEWVQKRVKSLDLHSQYLETAMQCWNEYFACRTVSGTYPFNVDNCLEIINTCKNAEKMLQEKRSKYNRQIISLNDFIIEFHKYTTFLLKKIAYAHGNLYCLADSKQDAIQTMEIDFEGAYIKAIWVEYGKAMDNLYVNFPLWKDETVFDDVISLIEKYYNQFEIYLHQESRGVYYDIPIKL